MAELSWIGRDAAVDNDPAYRDYTASKIAQNLTDAEVAAAINSVYSAYADKTYVNQQDALNATKGYVDTQDALNVRNNLKDVANGVAGLDGLGYINRARIATTDTQRFPRSFWSPPTNTYNSGTVTATAANPEVTLYTCTVTNPQFNVVNGTTVPGYSLNQRLVVTALVETWTDTDGVWPVVNVRQGSAAGTIVAQGFGGQTSKAWFGGDYFTRNTQLAASLNPVGGTYWYEVTMPIAGQTVAPGGNPYCDGTQALWNLDPHGTPAAPAPNGQRHKKFFLKAGEDKTTTSDYQEITATVGSVVTAPGSLFGYPAGVWFVGRANDPAAGATPTQYVAFRVTSDTVFFHICDGAEQQLASAPMTHATGDVLTARFGTSTSNRQFQFLKNGTQVLSYTDTIASKVGALFRRWGFGFEAGLNDSLFGGVQWQVTPASLTEIKCNDLPPTAISSVFRSTAVVRSLPLLVTTSSGATTLYVTLSRGSAGAIPSTATVSAGNYKPNLRVEAVPQ